MMDGGIFLMKICRAAKLGKVQTAPRGYNAIFRDEVNFLPAYHERTHFEQVKLKYSYRR